MGMNGKACTRVFGFDMSVRRKLMEFEATKSAVALVKCEVKSSRKGEELEVLLKKHTDLLKSQKVFDILEGTTKKLGKERVLSKLTDVAAF